MNGGAVLSSSHLEKMRSQRRADKEREKRGKEGERALSALANVPAADDAADDGDAECESSSLLKKH